MVVTAVLALVGSVMASVMSPATALGAPPPAETASPVPTGVPGLRAGTAAAPASGVWPLRPRPEVVRYFDPPDVRWGAGHRGVDLAGSVGQPVRTSLAGEVVFVGRIAGRGVVVVSHGATRTTYEPVTSALPVGTRVAAGQVIGRLAWFGSHCLPRACLHWGLKEGDRYLDPLTLVGGPKPVRLLPQGGLALAAVPP
jgi:murein DD-endopeptidase MepM/ murein hydrolase activator NlpD